jgi:hypothetical protein
MGAVTHRQDQITQYFHDPSLSFTSVASDAYTKAVEYFDKELTDKAGERAWVRGFTTLQDVRTEVEKAQKRYDTSKERHAKVCKVVATFAATPE